MELIDDLKSEIEARTEENRVTGLSGYDNQLHLQRDTEIIDCVEQEWSSKQKSKDYDSTTLPTLNIKKQTPKIKDHYLQFLLEPLVHFESTFSFFTLRSKVSQMDVLAQIRKRIGFFGVYNLFDQMDLKIAQAEAANQVQNRHAKRIQELESTLCSIYLD